MTDPGLTEMEDVALRLYAMNPGKTKRGAARKQRNLEAISRALGLSENSLNDAKKRGLAKLKAAKIDIALWVEANGYGTAA